MPDTILHRSSATEMMDEPGLRANLIMWNLRELDVLNHLTGSHAMIRNEVRGLIRKHKGAVHVTDLGCGSGDLLKYLASWARKKGHTMSFTGIDIQDAAIALLHKHCRDYSEINGIRTDYKEYLQSGASADIYVCSLFCHHLTDAQLNELFNHFKQKARIGFVVNDLRRSWAAWISVKIFTFLLKGSKMAKHDGPVSVLRGFRKSELKAILEKQHINRFIIKRKWGFRYLLTAKTD